MSSYYSLHPQAVALADAASKEAIIDEIARLFAQVYELDERQVHSALHLREDLGSTGFGRGVALPHARMPGLRRPLAVFLKLDAPVAYDAADRQPVEMVFGLLSPENAGATHLHALAAVSRMLRDERVHEALMNAPNAEALYGLLSNVTDRDAA